MLAWRMDGAAAITASGRQAATAVPAPAQAPDDAEAAALSAAAWTTQPVDAAAGRRFEACSRHYAQASERALQASIEAPDTRSQLALALLASRRTQQPGLTAEGRAGLLQLAAHAYDRALATSPRDPLVVWSRLESCRAWKDCDSTPWLRRLQELEPDNAATWLAAMADAHAAGNSGAAARHLARATQASYYDTHYNDRMLLLMDELAETPWPASCDAVASDIARAHGREPSREDVDVMFAVGAVDGSIDGMHGALRALCPPLRDGPVPSARKATCVAALMRLASADTMIDQLVALPRLADYTAGTSDGPYWQARLRDFQWLQHEGWRYSQQAPVRAPWEQGEVALHRSALEAAGHWPAPRGWAPGER